MTEQFVKSLNRSLKFKCWKFSVPHTWSLTLAVSSGKVTRSAMQAAVPAPKNFTAEEGTTSCAFMPTIFFSWVHYVSGKNGYYYPVIYLNYSSN